MYVYWINTLKELIFHLIFYSTVVIIVSNYVFAYVI